MWFLGLIVGAIIGGSIGSGEGAFFGAVIGAVAGGIFSSQRKAGEDERLKRVEEAIRELHQRVQALERSSSRAAAAAPAEPAATTSRPAAAAPVAGPPQPLAPEKLDDWVPKEPPAPRQEPAPKWFAEPRAPEQHARPVDAAPEKPAAAPVAPTSAATGSAAESHAPAPDRAPVEPALPQAAMREGEAGEQPAAPGPSGELRAEPAGEPLKYGRIQVIGAAIGAFIGFPGGFGGLVLGGIIGWIIALVVIAQMRDRAPARPGDADARSPATEVPSAADERVATPPPPPDTTAASAPTYEARAEPAVPPAEPAATTPVEPATAFAEAAPAEVVPEPAGPGWIQRLFSGNIVAKIGVVILFFGVGFLLKYAYDHAMLPMPLRLAGVALFGFAMLFVGWRLRDTRRLYGLILQGGGIGLLYLDVFFALRVAGLDMKVGFAAFMVLGVAATLLAVRQDSRVLAWLGLTGAFLAPVLAGSKTGNHVLLFSYYTLLNGFILGISWFKAWRELNLVGFIFTFVVGSLWGASNYRPELFATVEPFVLIFFAMYLVIPILFAQRQPPELKGLVDGTLVFGTPLAAAFMQAGLVRDMPYGLAWSAGCAAFLYALLAGTTIWREGMRLLGETYVALAILFLTFAIFFAFDAYPTFALWTLEGAAVVWVGLRQQRLLARLFGLALQLAGAFYFLIRYPDYSLANPWFNDFVIGCVIIAASGFIIAWLMHRYRAALIEGMEPPAALLAAWAGAWWSIAGVHSLYHAYPWAGFVIALLVFFAASFAVVEVVGARLRWPELRELTHAHLPALVLIAFLPLVPDGNTAAIEFTRPLAHGGYWAWPLNFAILFWSYRRQREAGVLPGSSYRYAGAWWLIAALSTWDVAWLLSHRDFAGVLAWGGAGLVLAAARFWWRERANPGAPAVSTWIVWWSAVWWFIGGFGLVERDVAPAQQVMVHLGFVTGTVVAGEWLGRLMGWSGLRSLALVHVPMMVAILISVYEPGTRPLGGAGLFAWPASVAAMFWILYRQQRDNLATAAALRYSLGWVLMVGLATWDAAWLLLHREYWGLLAWGVAAIVAGALRFWWCERDRSDAACYSAWVLWWGVACWFAGGVGLVERYAEFPLRAAWHLVFAAATLLAAECARRPMRWNALRDLTLLHVPLMVAIIVFAVDTRGQPLGGGGIVAWPASFAVMFWTLHRQHRDGVATALAPRYILGWALAAALATWEVVWQIAHEHYAWALAWSVLGMIAGYLRFRLGERDEADAKPVSLLALAWGAGFWFASGFAWIESALTGAGAVTAALGFVVASCAAFEAAGTLGAWPALRRPVVLLPAAMVLALAAQYDAHAHPFAAYGWLAWLAGLAVLYVALARQERAGVAVLGGAQHALALWVATVVLSWEIAWQLDSHGFGRAWVRAAWSLVPALGLWGVSAYSGRQTWPFGAHYPELYRADILGPIAAAAAAWALFLNLAPPGSMAPLPYVPLLNPIDAAQLAVLLALWRWHGTFDEGRGLSRAAMQPLLAGFAFLWVNCIALRTIHYWAGVAYRPDAMFNSILVQSTFSLLWTLTALVLMLHATRNAQRKSWVIGAGLLAVVVAKLFLLDLANSGTVERIVSFIGVGVGLLAIGYLAPVPPGAKEQQEG